MLRLIVIYLRVLSELSIMLAVLSEILFHLMVILSIHTDTPHSNLLIVGYSSTDNSLCAFTYTIAAIKSMDPRF